MISFFLPVALRKFNSLIKREDFECINEIDLAASKIEVKFKLSRCVIDKFGKVDWSDE